MLRDSERRIITNTGLLVAGFAAAAFVINFHQRVDQVLNPASPATSNPEISAPPPVTQVPESVLWRPINRGFSVATPIPRIVEIEERECNGLLASTDSEEGAATRRGPGPEFGVADATIPAGETLRPTKILVVRLTDRQTSYWMEVISPDPLSKSWDGKVTSYARLARPNTNEPGLGVNIDPGAICKSSGKP
jgi:hypothetical protein